MLRYVARLSHLFAASSKGMAKREIPDFSENPDQRCIRKTSCHGFLWNCSIQASPLWVSKARFLSSLFIKAFVPKRESSRNKGSPLNFARRAENLVLFRNEGPAKLQQAWHATGPVPVWGTLHGFLFVLVEQWRFLVVCKLNTNSSFPASFWFVFMFQTKNFEQWFTCPAIFLEKTNLRWSSEPFGCHSWLVKPKQILRSIWWGHVVW